MSTSFIHTSDWQLGMTRHFLDEDAQARFADARRAAIRTIGELAEEHEAEFVLVCGDVFESNHLDRRTVLRALEALADIRVPVYLLPGNHDPLNAGSIYNSATFRDRCPEKVHVIRDTQPVEVAGGVEIVGAPWVTKRPLTDLVWDAVEGLDSSTGTRIVAGHGQANTLAPDPDDPALVQIDRLENKIQEGVVDYVALGDRHSTTAVGDTRQIWYSGSPEPTAFDERDPGKALLVEITGEDVQVEQIPVARWTFESSQFTLGRDEDLDRLEAWLEEHEAKDRTVIKLALEGTLNLRQKAKVDEIMDRSTELFAAIEVWGRHTDLAIRPDDLDADLLDLSGFAREAFQRLEKRAKGAGEEARRAEDALGMLYRLAGGTER